MTAVWYPALAIVRIPENGLEPPQVYRKRELAGRRRKQLSVTRFVMTVTVARLIGKFDWLSRTCPRIARRWMPHPPASASFRDSRLAFMDHDGELLRLVSGLEGGQDDGHRVAVDPGRRSSGTIRRRASSPNRRHREASKGLSHCAADRASRCRAALRRSEPSSKGRPSAEIERRIPRDHECERLDVVSFFADRQEGVQSRASGQIHFKTEGSVRSRGR